MAKKETAAVATLDEQIASKRIELLETKRSHAAGELVNPRALGRIRKEIARLHTQKNAPSVNDEAVIETEETK